MMNEKINSTVYKLLNDLKYSTLPVDVHEIARRLGYSVRNYSQCKSLIKRLGFEKYTDNFQGISFKYDNIFYILISDELMSDDENKVIAHEIGHIKLHDTNIDNICGHSTETKINAKQEKEADEFALCLLAPLPLLENKRIKTATDIKNCTNLSFTDSNTVFENYREYTEQRHYINEIILLRDAVSRKGLYKRRVFSLIFVLLFSIVMFFLGTFVSKKDNYSTPAPAGTVVSENTKSNNKDSGAPGNVTPTDAVPLDNTATYYWTESGTVFHLYRDCQSIKNSPELHEGTLSAAKNEKDRLCKFCENRH